MEGRNTETTLLTVCLGSEHGKIVRQTVTFTFGFVLFANGHPIFRKDAVIFDFFLTVEAKRAFVILRINKKDIILVFPSNQYLYSNKDSPKN
jgi:hypothetical protein